MEGDSTATTRRGGLATEAWKKKREGPTLCGVKKIVLALFSVTQTPPQKIK